MELHNFTKEERMKFITWLLSNLTIADNTKDQIPVILTELGELQLYHFPTPEEVANGSPPRKVYWQNTKTKQSFGPFSGVYEAMRHYSLITQVKKAASKNNLIKVDFKSKKRVNIT